MEQEKPKSGWCVLPWSITSIMLCCCSLIVKREGSWQKNFGFSRVLVMEFPLLAWKVNVSHVTIKATCFLQSRTAFLWWTNFYIEKDLILETTEDSVNMAMISQLLPSAVILCVHFLGVSAVEHRGTCFGIRVYRAALIVGMQSGFLQYEGNIQRLLSTAKGSVWDLTAHYKISTKHVPQKSVLWWKKVLTSYCGGIGPHSSASIWRVALLWRQYGGVGSHLHFVR